MLQVFSESQAICQALAHELAAQQAKTTAYERCVHWLSDIVSRTAAQHQCAPCCFDIAVELQRPSLLHMKGLCFAGLTSRLLPILLHLSLRQWHDAYAFRQDEDNFEY